MSVNAPPPRVYKETATGRLVLTSSVSAPNNAYYIAGGTAAAPVTTATADLKMIEFRFENTATSGDNRGIYNRFYLSGAGGGGESLRSFTTVNNVACGTAHGAHLSLNFGTTGSITGLGLATRSTIHIPNGALTGGTYAAAQSEVWADGSSSDASGATVYSIHRFILAGNATGRATVPYVFEFVDLTTGTGTEMIKTDMHEANATDGLLIKVNGAGYWLHMTSV